MEFSFAGTVASGFETLDAGKKAKSTGSFPLHYWAFTQYNRLGWVICSELPRGADTLAMEMMNLVDAVQVKSQFKDVGNSQVRYCGGSWSDL